jgi:hypothetical protein
MNRPGRQVAVSAAIIILAVLVIIVAHQVWGVELPW